MATTANADATLTCVEDETLYQALENREVKRQIQRFLNDVPGNLMGTRFKEWTLLETVAVNAFWERRSLSSLKPEQRTTTDLNPYGTMLLLYKDADADYILALERLNELLREEPEDEYGVLRPTEYAFSLAMQLIYEGRLQYQGKFPRASVATDTEGGIHLYWKHSGKQLHLALPADAGKPLVLFYRVGNDIQTERNVTGNALAQWLERLVEA